MREMDNWCLQRHWLSKTEDIKRFKDSDKNRSWESKASAPSQNAKTFAKAWKNKKKNNYQSKRDYCAQKGSTPVTGVNTTAAGNSNKKKNSSTRRNPIKFVYYNCNKKSYYLNKCFKLSKAKN